MAAAEMATESTKPASDTDMFQAIESYPWDTDEEYQHGLQAILGPNPSGEQAKHLTLRSRCFYYARKFGTHVDFAAYQEWRDGRLGELQQPVAESRTGDLAQKPTEEQPPYPLSFNEIVELITTGKPVPGIKEIPSTVLEGQSSESKSSGRKKPWES